MPEPCGDVLEHAWNPGWNKVCDKPAGHLPMHRCDEVSWVSEGEPGYECDNPGAFIARRLS